MHKVSIIVPVHNSSSTLKKCVDSILNQTYKNLEVILIENGSQDNSLQMCEDYAQNDSRVKVLSLQESGISKARNAGLNCKTGDYFTFVDSDDFIELQMIEKLLNEAEKSQADMTFCRIKNMNADGKVFVSEEKRLGKVIFDNEIQYLFYLGTDDYVRNVAWRILYKADKFDGQLFNEEMTFNEDSDFLYRALTISRKNSLVSEPLYNYTYFYDKPEHIFNKYFKEIGSVLRTYKCYAISSFEMCKRYNLHEFAEAVLYYRFIAMVSIILQYSDYRKKMKLIYSDGFWCDIDTKGRYKAYKKFFGTKSKIKAFLIRHKLFLTFRILLKVKRHFRRK